MKLRDYMRICLLPMLAVSLGLLVVLAIGCDPATEEVTADQPADQPTEVAEFVNIRCPMMGSEMDLTNVPDSLTRTYNGRQVAFCCGACPSAWDALTDAEKDAKLAEVAP